MRQIIIFLLLFVCVFISTTPTSLAMPLGASSVSTFSTMRTTTLARLELATGTYFGVNLDWSQDTAASYRQRLGRAPSVYVNFFRFPFENSDLYALEGFISQVGAHRGMAMLTLEPVKGLEAVTPEVAEDLALRLSTYNASGVPTFVRFAHEMNGSWYPWSQRPDDYIQKFRLLADAVHQHAPQFAMVCAPNYGAGYPYFYQ